MLIHPQIDPVAIAIGPLAVRWYGLMYLIGFGLAFLDPPYVGGDAVAALIALAELPLLLPGARVVVEHSRRESLPEACGGLTRLTVRRYGDTQVAFYLMAESAPQEHD